MQRPAPVSNYVEASYFGGSIWIESRIAWSSAMSAADVPS